MLLWMDWWWNHVDCPCCCCDVLLLMIRTLGIHNHWDCCENWFVLEIFTKWVKWWFLFKGVLTQILYGFEPLLMSENVWVNFGNKFGLGGFKIGVLGWKMRFYDSKLSWLARRVSLLATASEGVTESMLCLPRRAGPLAIASNVVTERVLCLPRRANPLGRRVALVPVFLFCVLCPFYTFLFWIGFWYKHGSFK